MSCGGLTEIYAPHEIASTEIEFIFVHGLNPKAAESHGRQTWTHSNRVFWPRDIMPKLLPKARIFLFEYNSQVTGSGAANLGIRDHAENLLDCYRAVKPPSKLPIIFICHSLGGLVVKYALSQALSRDPNDPEMAEIKNLTYGVVFFGTPHRGGNGVTFGQVLEKVVGTFTGGGANSLLQSLKPADALSLEAQEMFRTYIEDFHYLSIIEGKPKTGIGIVVPRGSATLGAAKKRETVIAVDADHSKMCKFESQEGTFTPIKRYILQMATRAVQESRGLEEGSSQEPKPPSMESSPRLDSSSARTISSSSISLASLDRSAKETNIKFVNAAKFGDTVNLLLMIKAHITRSQLSQESINTALIELSRNVDHGRLRPQVVDCILYNCPHNLDYTDAERGRTPLMWAAYFGHEAILNLLIAKGASQVVVDESFKRTPLMWAATSGALKSVKMLLEKIQNPQIINTQDIDGETALTLAYQKKYLHTAEALLDHNADPNLHAGSSAPLLVHAVFGQDEDFVRLLIEKGADAKCKTLRSVPILSIAVYNKSLAMVKLLIAGGADVQATDPEGKLPLDWAIKRFRDNIGSLKETSERADALRQGTRSADTARDDYSSPLPG